MAKNDNLTDFLKDVADAIREKKGSSNLINPQDFSAEIASIKSGGGGGGGAVAVSPKAANFRDYDGTILHSYTKDEFLALNELPPLPTREGLICQGWNWDYADAVEYVTEYGVLEVGATYITDDGKTRLYITIEAEGRMDVPLYFSQTVANGVTIDWGDGSATETLASIGNLNLTHHYDRVGEYIISIEAANGAKIGFGAENSSYCVMGATNKLEYCNLLKKVEVGNGVTGLRSYSFQKCYSLRTITLPLSLSSIKGNVFNSCYALKSAVIPKSVTSFSSSSTFNACYTMRSVVLSQNFISILGYAFSNCYCLSSVVIPKGMISIGASDFASCKSMVSIVIPKNITTISDSAFSGATGMAFYDFSTLETVPTLGTTSAFKNIASDCKIIVPDALYDSWIAATNWSTYASQTIKKSEWDVLNA